jgi:hypothetical protein
MHGPVWFVPADPLEWYAGCLTHRACMCVWPGYRSIQLHRGLPDGRSNRTASHKVHVLRDITYGEKERNNMDVYIPPSTRRVPTSGYPVALFVHGGGLPASVSIATGQSRCARSGVVVVMLAHVGQFCSLRGRLNGRLNGRPMDNTLTS